MRDERLARQSDASVKLHWSESAFVGPLSKQNRQRRAPVFGVDQSFILTGPSASFGSDRPRRGAVRSPILPHLPRTSTAEKRPWPVEARVTCSTSEIDLLRGERYVPLGLGVYVAEIRDAESPLTGTVRFVVHELAGPELKIQLPAR